MKKLLLFLMLIGFYCVANAQNTTSGTGDNEKSKLNQSASAENNTFPYGKMLNMTEEELKSKKFKYSEQYNRWVLTYVNGANSFLSAMQAMNGQAADIQPHPNDYSVTIQRGDNDVAYISVVFYKDDTYHDILTFVNDNGTDVLETSSGDIVKTQFNYDKYSFTLEMKRIGKSTVTRKTATAAKQIDSSYNSYNFTIYTGVTATSPYLTKQAEKEARRDSKGRKENNVDDLMF
ncbi:MAG: hypothetical protein RR277_01030 [Rikenellaceae bacterium]